MEKVFTTNQAASILGVRPQTLRKRFCHSGTYFGVRPSKLPNGKLRWPADAVETFMSGGSK